MKQKRRLDVYLVELGLFPNQQAAAAAIMAGQVLVDEQKLDKAGAPISGAPPVRLLGKGCPYVSRGGLKLEKALACFALDLSGLVVLDIGSSTGGFVDCALQHGAARVYAVDVGRNQLAWKLRQDPRVLVREQTNARFLDAAVVPEPVDLLTADVSFISLTLALPRAVQTLLRPGGGVAALIKPQFEAEREQVAPGGLVRDPAVHQQVIHRILQAFADWDLAVQGLDFSPITGAEGNIEYLVHAVKGGTPCLPDISTVIAAAQAAHGPA